MGRGINRAFSGLFGSEIYDSEKALKIIKDFIKNNNIEITNKNHFQENQINDKSAIVLSGNLKEQLDTCSRILKENIDTAIIHTGEDDFRGQLEINTGEDYYYYYSPLSEEFYKTNTFIVYANTRNNFHMTGYGGKQVDERTINRLIK